MSDFGSTELILLGLILIFLFGNKKIPEFIRGIGEAVREYRKAVKGKE